MTADFTETLRRREVKTTGAMRLIVEEKSLLAVYHVVIVVHGGEEEKQSDDAPQNDKALPIETVFPNGFQLQASLQCTLSLHFP